MVAAAYGLPAATAAAGLDAPPTAAGDDERLLCRRGVPPVEPPPWAIFSTWSGSGLGLWSGVRLGLGLGLGVEVGVKVQVRVAVRVGVRPGLGLRVRDRARLGLASG